jgi:hypothetical protein
MGLVSTWDHHRPHHGRSLWCAKLVNGNGNVWKWVAGVEALILTSMLLMAVPIVLWLAQAPTGKQVDQIEERQQLVLQRLAVLEQRLLNVDTAQADQDMRLDEIRGLLEVHITAGRR